MFDMKLLHESGKYYYISCERCSKENKVLKISCQLNDIGYKSNAVIMCSCGESSNIIKKPANKQLFQDTDNSNEILRCPKCKSTQLSAGDKGFSLGKAAVGGALLGGVGLLGGLIGSKKLMVGCMNCGHKWEAGTS